MTSRVYRRIPTCDPALVEAAAKSAVADLHESMPEIQGRMALMNPEIRALNRGLRIAGQAVTAYNLPGDGLAGYKALQLAGPGQVLVYANGGHSPCAQFAELVSLAARKSGVAGVIADGPIRDSDALTESRFPVWARGTFCGHTSKRGPGEVNVPVVCGGALVEPGDIIVADGDGVICIPLQMVEGVLVKARERAAREERIRAAIEDGQSLAELIGVQAALDAADTTEIDSTWVSAQ